MELQPQTHSFGVRGAAVLGAEQEMLKGPCRGGFAFSSAVPALHCAAASVLSHWWWHRLWQGHSRATFYTLSYWGC